MSLPTILHLLVATLSGLAVGTERQWSGHASGPHARFAGLRTFTMLGALATEFYVRPGQQDWLVALALRLIAIGVPLTIWSFVRFELPWLRARRRH